MGKRRSSAHQRWAAGPGFKGKLESVLKTISHHGHISMLSLLQRGAQKRKFAFLIMNLLSCLECVKEHLKKKKILNE